MLYRDICKILAYFVFGFTITLLVPLILSIYYQYYVPPSDHPQPHATYYFIETIAISFLLGACLWFIGRRAKGTLYRREGIAVVVVIWFLLPALGGLPFFISGTLKNPFAAYMESISGFTTTGSTTMEAKHFDPVTGKEIPIVRTVKGSINTTYIYYGTIDPVRDPKSGKIIHEGVEAVGKALLFWRSFIQWLGGGGIVILFLAILPALGVGGKVLFHTEITGPIKEAMTPRIKETAIQMWRIYLGLTVIVIVLTRLANTNIDWFDTITIGITALSTGGFSVRNASIAAYHSPSLEWAVIIGMLLGSINFSLYYYIIKSKFYKIYEPEFFLYIIILLVSCGICSGYLVGVEKQLLTQNTPEGVFSISEAIRHATFQIVACITSSGFTTANYDIWPFACQMLMLIVMFVGGMSGSTSGGIKIIRHYMLFRIAQHKVESIFRPETVRTFRVGNREVDRPAMMMVLCFFLLIISISTVGTMLYIFSGIDMETSIGLVACMINCTGVSFRAAGPMYSCAFLSDFGLLLSSLLMILGRLEFFAVLAFLVPAFWKKTT